MENQSMRRRQTVHGDQLEGTNYAAAPMERAPAQKRRPSRPNQAGMPASAAAARTAALGPPAVPPHASLPKGSARSASKSKNSSNGSLNANSSASSLTPGSLSVNGQRANTHHRSFSRMSARIDDSGFSLGDQSSVRSFQPDLDFDTQLMDPKMDPVMYLTKHLAGASAEDIVKFGERLKQQAQIAAETEQQTLQHNQKSLTQIARNVAKTAPAVAELRTKVGELSLVTDAMRQDSLTAQTDAQMRRLSVPQNGRRISSQNGRHSTPNGITSVPGTPGDSDDSSDDENGPRVLTNKRQSMFVLHQPWANGLNNLYKRVQGAQQVVPPVRGRHVVMEEHGWMEMNLVTLKPVKPVLIVLLSDSVLVAAHHKGQYAHEWHTSLEEPLEISIDEGKKLLKIAHLGLVAPSMSRLRAVYGELFKLNELACASSQSNRGVARTPSFQKTQRTPKSHGRNHSRTQNSDSRKEHSRQISHHSISSIPEITVEQKREGARILAEIDAEIAERRFAVAVEECLDVEDDVIIRPLVADRAQRLAEILLEQVRQFSRLTQQELVTSIGLLIKLRRGVEARQTLLDAAARDIENQARKVHFMGDVSSYISQMAAIYFQTINSTITVYRKCFPASKDSSVIVSWTKSQVDIYAAIFNRQLFRIAPEFQAYQKCREVSRLESSQLREQKINMDFMLRYVWES